MIAYLVLQIKLFEQSQVMIQHTNEKGEMETPEDVNHKMEKFFSRPTAIHSLRLYITWLKDESETDRNKILTDRNLIFIINSFGYRHKVEVALQRQSS